MAIVIKKPQNPFFTGIAIPNDYFCGRKKETEDITRLLKNGKNIVLMAPRRVGKSSLIKHILSQNEFKKEYNSIYVDIMGTTDADEFIRAFQNEILKQPFARLTKHKEAIKDIFSHPVFNLDDPINPLPKIGFNPSGKIELSIDKIFELLEDTDKPNVIVFDEFQQIEDYPERMAGILRSHVQQCNNSKFIFSGSEQHMLAKMFNAANEPFFNSAEPMELDIISLETYSEFCKSNFKKYEKSINDEAIELVYYLFSGNTYCLQEMMNEVFSLLDKGKTAGKDEVMQAIETSLERREQNFKEILRRYPNQKERKVLFCIANEGTASRMLSKEIIKKYELDNPASVQNALNNLVNRDKKKKETANTGLGVVTEFSPNHYKLKDKYFELWIVHDLPSFNYKIENAKELFQKERALIKESAKIKLPKYFSSVKRWE